MVENSKKCYENGRIYCIRNNKDDDLYVGSSCQPLSKRMEKHRYDMRNKKKNNCSLYKKMNEIGVEHFYIELIEECPCENIEQLRKKEGEWIRQMATLNDQIAGRTTIEYRQETKDHKQEYDKLYSEANKYKKREQAKIRYENKKEEIKQKTNEYYHKNKDKIAEHNKQMIECPCGVKLTQANKARHLKSKHHQNYEKSLLENND